MSNLLKIKDLTLGYGEKRIFSNINVEQGEGELVALIGSNGMGKSTLLRTISNLEPKFSKNKGEILYKDYPLDKYNKGEISQLVSYVSPIIEKTEYLKVIDLISINTYYRTNWIGKLNSKEEERIKKALELVGLEGFEYRYCNSLSDGEYQRVTIAGALVQDSKIILLDEPTAFLDIANKFLITRLLKNISQREKKLIIFSTHDIQLAMQVCDKLWIMTSQGFFSGTTQELIDKNILDKIFNVEGVVFDSHIKSFRFEKQIDNQ